MTEKINKNPPLSESQDSLVNALESIKALLAKSDSKLAAARESIAIASQQTAQGHKNVREPIEIPVLDDIVIPAEVEVVIEEVSSLPEQISKKPEEALTAVIPNLPIASPKPDVMLKYLDTLQEKLEKTLRDSLMKSIVTIESGMRASLVSEIDKIREQVKKDFR